jgi:hypothetical protein
MLDSKHVFDNTIDGVSCTVDGKRSGFRLTKGCVPFRSDSSTFALRSNLSQNTDTVEGKTRFFLVQGFSPEWQLDML